jgi:hypothetical protein
MKETGTLCARRSGSGTGSSRGRGPRPVARRRSARRLAARPQRHVGHTRLRHISWGGSGSSRLPGRSQSKRPDIAGVDAAPPDGRGKAGRRRCDPDEVDGTEPVHIALPISRGARCRAPRGCAHRPNPWPWPWPICPCPDSGSTCRVWTMRSESTSRPLLSSAQRLGNLPRATLPSEARRVARRQHCLVGRVALGSDPQLGSSSTSVSVFALSTRSPHRSSTATSAPSTRATVDAGNSPKRVRSSRSSNARSPSL